MLRIIHITLLFSTLFAFAQNTRDNLFNNTNELYFKFQIEDISELNTLTDYISIAHKREGLVVYAFCNKKQYDAFSKLGYTIEVLPTPSTQIKNPKMQSVIDIKSSNDWDFYPTYSAYISMMNQFATDYPDICQVFSIGTSVNGHELMVARISDNVGVEEGDAKVLYTSTMHGNETTGYVLALRLINYLLTNYNSDSQIANMVNHLDIFINPLANPDGTYATNDNTVYGATRYNANWVDLNRNYPDPQDGSHPDGEVYQPETLAFIALAETHNFVLSSNWHTGTEVYNYPWDTWGQLAADDAWWIFTGNQWSNTVHDYSSDYFTDYNNGITNGYDWYEVNGGRQDYMNAYHQCREFTLELSDEFSPDGSDLPSYWNYQYRSFLSYLEQALYGVNGRITDFNTGEALQAKVFVESHDDNYSFVNSDATTGNYYRPIIEGNYSITFSAPDYISQTIHNVSITNLETTVLDVQLVPYSTVGIENTELNSLKIFPNPAIDNLRIKTKIPILYTEIIDVTGQIILQNSHDRTAIVNLNISKLPLGIYVLKTYTNFGIISSKLVKQ